MSAASNVSRPMSNQILWRLLVGVGGGYAFTHGAFALITAGGSRLGLHYDDAWMLAAMVAFPLLLIVVLWAFAARRLPQVALVLLGGAIVMLGLALLLVRATPGLT